LKTKKIDIGADDLDVAIEVVGGDAAGGLTPVSKDRTQLAIDQVARVAKLTAQRLRAELTAAADPSELAIEFGMSIQGGATFVLCAAGTFKVTVKWTKTASEAPVPKS
jgi:NTP-dependent ternary system trypsin peptidase co-occuring protein